MMIELPVNTISGSVFQLIALKTIRRAVPERNWTRITLDNKEEILITWDYQKTAEKIKNKTDKL